MLLETRPGLRLGFTLGYSKPGMLFIGNQTSCWASAPSEPFDYAVAQRFSAFEWFPDKKPGAGWDEDDLKKDYRESIWATAKQFGIRLSVHAQWQANPFEADGCLLLSKDVSLACDLGAALVNIHLFHDRGPEAFVEALLPWIERTAQAGLQLAIENTPHHAPEQFNQLFARIREHLSIETSHVGMCLDLGHANLSSTTRNDYLKFIDRLDPEVPIIHVHVHENWGDTDSHLPFFTGPAGRDDSGIRGVVERLKRRHFSGSMILEQWPHPPSLLKEARDRLQGIWDSSQSASAREPTSDNASAQPLPSAVVQGGDFASQLAAGDRRNRSWREKLELVTELLEKPLPAIKSDQLVDIAIYLRFLGTGAISCSEDGRHFRPAHHARLSSRIQQQLARFKAADDRFVLRKIYPWLPSSSATFQRPEPLTRIRDIAHRNDIGSDLKREIKTRLQNKLHRCAGPEDLVTSSEILERICAKGANYPPAFVEQFRIFHEELKEFFNARSLDDRLKALRSKATPSLATLVDRFLGQKANVGLPEQLGLLQTLTELRGAFANLVSGKSAHETQEIMLADISLEDFAFTLLSQISNACDKAAPDEAMKAGTESLILALTNLSLNGINPPETLAVLSELRSWGIPRPATGREEILRLGASLLRCRRLAQDFSAQVIAVFANEAEKLGRALGVAEHACRVFAEADIRSHLIFQVSKFADALLRQTRDRLGLSSWDVIVPGRAQGRAQALNSLANWRDTGQGPVVVILKHSNGDEEIPKSVVAIVLAHEMAHLAHLSVRARQAGVVFATCDEASQFDRFLTTEGNMISVTAFPDGVLWEPAPEKLSTSRSASRAVPEILEPDLSITPSWIPIESVQIINGGAKSVGMRRLTDLSHSQSNLFATPWGIIIPFGVMKAAFDAAPGLAQDYWRLAGEIDALEGHEFASTLERLQNLVQQLKVPDEITAEVRRRIGEDSAVIVRSSANCEDLAGFAAAGLHESVPNVSPSALESAIRQVWASLWTRRAAESRRAAGIRHEQAYMAVLIQEFFDPEVAFVLHTVDPASGDPNSLYAEIVVGLGETIASGSTAGSPYRLSYEKPDGPAKILAFANFSHALRTNPGGGLRKETLDYSQVRLSKEFVELEKLARHLTKVGTIVERALGGPQDIEGFVSNDRIYLVQARPQQGLSSRTAL